MGSFCGTTEVETVLAAVVESSWPLVEKRDKQITILTLRRDNLLNQYDQRGESLSGEPARPTVAVDARSQLSITSVQQAALGPHVGGRLGRQLGATEASSDRGPVQPWR